jgi:heptosyltransferase-2
MRLGVFLPNWIGDVVMATPALRALREHLGPEGELIGIMRPYVADVLAGTAWLDETIFYTKEADEPEFSRRAVLENLRGARLDHALLFTNSLRTGWMAWRSGARERTGYVGNLRSWRLTRRLKQERRGPKQLLPPPIDSYLQLAASIGCTGQSRRMELGTTPNDEHAANEVWKQLGLPPGERVIMLNSGGAFGAAKHWPAEHFAELARRIVGGGRHWVLVNCGPAERDIAVEIVARADHRRVVGLGEMTRLPLGLTKACIRRVRLLVTTDSGPRFFGIAFSKPIVTLFGPTSSAATTTYYERETCLTLSLDCQPCMERVCPLGHHRCMRDLSVDRVHAVVNRYLEVEPARHGVISPPLRLFDPTLVGQAMPDDSHA